jgi:hypothetical protein
MAAPAAQRDWTRHHDEAGSLPDEEAIGNSAAELAVVIQADPWAMVTRDAGI